MGVLGYEFANLSKEQVAARRISLDQHAFIAQTSQLVVIAALVALRLVASFLTRWTAGDAESAPSSPQKKYLAEGRGRATATKIAQRWRILQWKLGNEVKAGYGTWAQWIGGILWTIWLGALCLQGTAPDYMHFTKRFGLVAASQLPLHYLLAMKSSYSPLQMLLRMSHESLNAAHQVLGRIVSLFMLMHAALYINFFLVTGFWVNRIKDRDVIPGLISAVIVAAIATTSTGIVRRWNYRLFFSIHAVAPVLVLIPLYFHVRHIRIYVLEAFAFALLNIGRRLWSMHDGPAQIQALKETSLIRITAQGQTLRGSWKPGSHVYLRVPGGISSYVTANPFTIATLPGVKDGQPVLVARILRGKTKDYARLAKSSGDVAESSTQTIKLRLEGPYGHSAYLPDLIHFEKIIFVAGGVGATYILPMLKYAQQIRAQATKHQAFKLIWSMKSLQESLWSIESLANIREEATAIDEHELYVTGSGQVVNEAQGWELTERSATAQVRADLEGVGCEVHPGRPDFRQLVDQSIGGSTGQVAVFVCGPNGMTASLRQCVGRWVIKGHDIYWHVEAFGL